MQDALVCECVRVLPARRRPHVGGFQTNRRPPCQGGLHGLLASRATIALRGSGSGGRACAWSARLGPVRQKTKLFYRAGILFAIMSRGTHTSITAVAWKRRMQAGWRGKEQLAAPPPLAALPQRACCKQPHGGACPDPRCARTT